MEKLQFDDVDTLANALTFYSVVAWKLLALTYLLRVEPTSSARGVFETDEVRVLAQLSSTPVISVSDAILALAKIVGFAPSTKQPYPGVKVLATAMERFFFIKLGSTLSSSTESNQLNSESCP